MSLEELEQSKARAEAARREWLATLKVGDTVKIAAWGRGGYAYREATIDRLTRSGRIVIGLAVFHPETGVRFGFNVAEHLEPMEVEP